MSPPDRNILTNPKAHAKRILQDWIEDEAHAESLQHWPDLRVAFEWLRSIADGPSDEPSDGRIPTDGQLMDQLEAAFERMNDGYVEQDLQLRRTLADNLVRFNRPPSKSVDPRNEAASWDWRCPHCGGTSAQHSQAVQLGRCSQKSSSGASFPPADQWTPEQMEALQKASGGMMVVTAEQAKHPLAFRHWSKDINVPYDKCHCFTCTAART